MRQHDTIDPRHVATVHRIIESWACDGKQIQDMRKLRDAMEDALQAETDRRTPPPSEPARGTEPRTFCDFKIVPDPTVKPGTIEIRGAASVPADARIEACVREILEDFCDPGEVPPDWIADALRIFRKHFASLARGNVVVPERIALARLIGSKTSNLDMADAVLAEFARLNPGRYVMGIDPAAPGGDVSVESSVAPAGSDPA